MKILTLLMISLFLQNCSTVKNFFVSDRTFYRSDYEIIQLTDNENSKKLSQHPINITPERIEGALHLILLKKDKTTIPLFNDRKRMILAENLSKALSKARPDQDIIFSIEDWFKNVAEGNTLSIKKNYVTSARIFFYKNNLHIIFGSIMRKGAISGDVMIKMINPDIKSNPYAPGSRKYSVSNNAFRLAAPPNSGVFRPNTKKPRADWLVFSVRSLKQRGQTTQIERKQARTNTIEVKSLRAELNELKKELRGIRGPLNQGNYSQQYGYPQQQYTYPQSQYVYPQQQYSYPQPQYVYPQQQYSYPQQNRRITERKYSEQTQIKIEELKFLRNKGLISEKEYIERMKNL